MAASGISYLTAPLALAAGASGVGVGSAINKLNSDIAMVPFRTIAHPVLVTAPIRICRTHGPVRVGRGLHR